LGAFSKGDAISDSGQLIPRVTIDLTNIIRSLWEPRRAWLARHYPEKSTTKLIENEPRFETWSRLHAHWSWAIPATPPGSNRNTSQS